MLNNSSKLDWEYWEDENREDPWPKEPPHHGAQSGLASCQGVRRMIVFAVTMVSGLTAGIETTYARNEAQKSIADVEEGVQTSVEVEAWMQEYEPQESAELLIDGAASGDVEWMMASEKHLLRATTHQGLPVSDIQVTDTHFRGSSAAAKVQVTLPDTLGDGPHVFHQTRFYSETPQGWLRTRPLPALWGQPRSLETEHIAWRHRLRDEDVVLDIELRIDARYSALLADYGLIQVPREGKLIVYVGVGYLRGKLLLQMDPPNSTTVPSPAVYLLPEQYANADVLAQTVGLDLLESIWNQAALTPSLGRNDALLAGVRSGNCSRWGWDSPQARVMHC